MIISNIINKYIRNKYGEPLELKPPIGPGPFNRNIFKKILYLIHHSIWKLDTWLFYKYRKQWEWWLMRNDLEMEIDEKMLQRIRGAQEIT